jgi:glycosyltransferase involved in cell wall biosynthesis
LLHQVDSLLETAAYAGVRIICLAPPERLSEQGWKNIEVRKVGVNRQNIWEQIDLPFYARGHLLFSPGNSGPVFHSRQVVTLHDASVFAFPAAYSRAFRIKYHVVLRMLVRSARLIFTDSRFSQQELAKYLGVSGDQFNVIYLGGDHLARVASDNKVLEQNQLNKNSYLLTVASNSPHKNFPCVIEAARKVRAQNIQFVAVGGTFRRVFQSSGSEDVPDNVRLLGYVSDGEVKALYENAAGFIFPSLYEGFGLPVLEAMGAGCPVLCANSASLPEVGGEAALYFDAMNADDLAGTIDRFLSVPGLRETMRIKGLEQCARFRWEMTARNTLDAIIHLL